MPPESVTISSSAAHQVDEGHVVQRVEQNHVGQTGEKA